jgi:hypothetical protein
VRKRRAPRRPLDGLRRLTECSQERLTHAFTITKAGLSRDDFDWMTRRLHHQASGFDA